MAMLTLYWKISKSRYSYTIYLTSENEETGQAFITVDEAGQNIILVYGGANMTLSATDVEMSAEAFIGADFVGAA